jgi:hypothetical protein
MFRTLKNKTRGRSAKRSLNSVNYESLEQRELLATVNYLQGGTLLILGDAARDSVTISIRGSFVEALVNGTTYTGFPTSGVNKIQFHGGDSADHFFNLTSIPSLVYSGSGDDTIIGGEGRDEIYGGDGSDDLQGNGGFDKIHGGNGDDLIRGGTGDDYLVGNNGNDQLWGEDQNDRLLGGAGDDKLYGGDGEDWLYGFDGMDFLDGGNDRDRIFSGGGRFNESRLDPTDFWNDSELVRGSAGQVSRIKGNFSRISGNDVYLVLGNNTTSQFVTVNANTDIRMFGAAIPVSMLNRNQFLEIEYDFTTRVASSIKASSIYVHEGNDQSNAIRPGAISFSPGALHKGGIVGNASSAQDVDWYFFRSNVSGRIRMRATDPTSSGWAGANFQVQTANGTILNQTDYFINNFMDLELNKGQLYYVKATGYRFEPTPYQLLFEPLSF